MKLGTAKYDSNGLGKKRFKIVDGDNVYRILPPMGSLADQGRWSQYWSVVWGYTNPEGKSVPFSDCRKTNYRTRMVEVESAAYLKTEKIKAQYEALKLAVKSGEAVDEKTLERMEKLAEKFNIDNKHYVNAVNLQGEIGLLKIGAKAKQLLEEEIKKLTAKGIDPLSVDNGRYFNIFRSGRGFNTVYQVTAYKEQRQMADGEIAEFAKTHKMDDAFISRLGAEAHDLGTLYSRPTPDQVSEIVNGANPDVVLGINRNGSAAPAAAAAVVVEENDEEEVYVAPAPKVEVKAEVKAPAPKVEAPAAQTAALSDEDFLKQMGM